MHRAAIRRARPDDADFLAWVVLASARSHRPRGSWDLFVPEGEAERLAFAKALLLDAPPSWWHASLFWVAERDGAPAAALSGFDPAQLDFEAAIGCPGLAQMTCTL
jgi:hypothetical protein